MSKLIRLELEERVWALARKRAKVLPYEDLDPSEILRRALASPSRTRVEVRQRAPKAELAVLVQRGLLEEGRTLYFVDFSGRAHPSRRATVDGKSLRYKRAQWSMTALAREFLREDGYPDTGLGGPRHWQDSVSGKTIEALWQQVLKSTGALARIRKAG